VALFGSAGEAALVGEVEGLVRAAGVRVENYAGKTRLREFIAEVARCNVMLTNDSGAMHVAYAVGTPSVTVFGPTDPVGTGPVGETARIVREAVDCAPCKLRECPIDHRCMKAISAEQVAREALVLLK
jgi:heptosyltransferase-2